MPAIYSSSLSKFLKKGRFLKIHIFCSLLKRHRSKAETLRPSNSPEIVVWCQLLHPENASAPSQCESAFHPPLLGSTQTFLRERRNCTPCSSAASTPHLWACRTWTWGWGPCAWSSTCLSGHRTKRRAGWTWWHKHVSSLPPGCTSWLFFSPITLSAMANCILSSKASNCLTKISFSSCGSATQISALVPSYQPHMDPFFIMHRKSHSFQFTCDQSRCVSHSLLWSIYSLNTKRTCVWICFACYACGAHGQGGSLGAQVPNAFFLPKFWLSHQHGTWGQSEVHELMYRVISKSCQRRRWQYVLYFSMNFNEIHQKLLQNCKKLPVKI